MGKFILIKDVRVNLDAIAGYEVANGQIAFYGYPIYNPDKQELDMNPVIHLIQFGTPNEAIATIKKLDSILVSSIISA